MTHNYPAKCWACPIENPKDSTRFLLTHMFGTLPVVGFCQDCFENDMFSPSFEEITREEAVVAGVLAL